MNCSGEDIPDLDFEPDLLINLLGKLSLDSIPNDVSETLEALENRTRVTALNESAQAQNTTVTYCSSELYDSMRSRELHEDEASKTKKEKESFLSSIGLVSGNPYHQATFTVKDWLPNQTEKHPTQGKSSSLKATTVKKQKASSSFFCDNLDFPRQRFSYPAGSFRHKSVNSLQNVFTQRGMVFDIQLCDIDSSSSLPPFTFTDEADIKADTPSDNFLQVVNSADTTEKSMRSPDSGYDTSSCPSALSPCSTPICAESYNFCDNEQTSDDELDRIIATIVEVENSLSVLEHPPVDGSVPILKTAKDPEVHKEDILNFLKEPIGLLPYTAAPVEVGEQSSCSELCVNDLKKSNFSVPLPSSKVFKKYSPNTKDHKLGYEFKYAAKNDLCHSSIFTNVKHISERNKILKQIQEDERAKKQIKVIQLMSKKLKRSAVDDRENKKKRIHYVDSSF